MIMQLYSAPPPKMFWCSCNATQCTIACTRTCIMFNDNDKHRWTSSIWRGDSEEMKDAVRKGKSSSNVIARPSNMWISQNWSQKRLIGRLSCLSRNKYVMIGNLLLEY